MDVRLSSATQKNYRDTPTTDFLWSSSPEFVDEIVLSRIEKTRHRKYVPCLPSSGIVYFKSERSSRTGAPMDPDQRVARHADLLLHVPTMSLALARKQTSQSRLDETLFDLLVHFLLSFDVRQLMFNQKKRTQQCYRCRWSRGKNHISKIQTIIRVTELEQVWHKENKP